MHKVKCFECGEYFDRDKIPAIKVTANRYIHAACAPVMDERILKKEQDKQELYLYVMELFKIPSLNGRLIKQIQSYVKDYNYSYSGIKKTLKYFYEIKGNAIEKARGGIGIVPYQYEEANEYYYSLWEAEQYNKQQIQHTLAEEEEEKIINIPQPKRKNKIKKKKLFSFLDEEE